MATHTAKDAREVRNARLRREVDKENMEALDDMIPSEHFEGIGEDDDRPYGEKAKTMKAAAAYIKELETKIEAFGERTPSAGHGGAVIATISPAWVTDIEGVAAIRQRTTRLRQTVEGKVRAEGGLGGDLLELVNKANDLLVDLVDAVEQAGMTDKQKDKWAELQEDLGRSFRLQKGDSEEE